MLSILDVSATEIDYTQGVIAIHKFQNILMMIRQLIQNPKNTGIKTFARKTTHFFEFPKVERHYENAKLIWIVRLRWAAISLFFFLAGPGYIFGALNASTLGFFIGIIGFLFVFNLFTYLIFADSKKPVGSVFICFQLALDLTALASLLLISGGFENPFIALFLLNAGLGGVLIRGQFSLPFIFLCHAFLVALQKPYVIENIEARQNFFWIYIFASHILVFSGWLVMRSLGTYLESHFENQSLLSIQTEKQDRLRALGALAAGFSHEFASPLNAAVLQLDRLERILTESNKLTVQQLEERLRQAREGVLETKDSIRKCEHVIHSMNAAQLDVRTYNLKPVNMMNFIQEIADSWCAEHRNANLVILNTLKNSLLISPINLAQVILNLLDNAFEANPGGQILLSLKTENNWVILSVDDCGPGFSKKMLQHRGEPFITTKKQGTGLGLYVSEIFVQSLGGHLSIKNKSEYETGAIVMLRWPLQSTIGSHL